MSIVTIDGSISAIRTGWRNKGKDDAHALVFVTVEAKLSEIDIDKLATMHENMVRCQITDIQTELPLRAVREGS